MSANMPTPVNAIGQVGMVMDPILSMDEHHFWQHAVYLRYSRLRHDILLFDRSTCYSVRTYANLCAMDDVSKPVMMVQSFQSPG